MELETPAKADRLNQKELLSDKKITCCFLELLIDLHKIKYPDRLTVEQFTVLGDLLIGWKKNIKMEIKKRNC